MVLIVTRTNSPFTLKCIPWEWSLSSLLEYEDVDVEEYRRSWTTLLHFLTDFCDPLRGCCLIAATEALLVSAFNDGLVQRLWCVGLLRRTGIRDRNEALFLIDEGIRIPISSIFGRSLSVSGDNNYTSTEIKLL